MTPKEEKLLALIFLIIYGLIGIYAFGIFFGILFALFFTWFTHIIICRVIYGKTLGTKLSPFATHIFDSKGNLIASFKGDDWYAIERPQPLTKKQEIKVKFEKSNPNTTVLFEEEKKEVKEEKFTIDYFKKYLEFLDLYASKFIPEDLNKLNDFIEDTIRRVHEDVKLCKDFQSLNEATKLLFLKLVKSLLKSLLMTGEPLKIYKIVSLSNNVFIYWIAQGEPAEYYSYRTKQKFRKWRSWLPWQKGMNVVEMWGVEIDEIHEISGVELRTLMCLPIQDETYRELKNFTLQKYEVIAGSLARFTQEVMPMLPYFDELELKLAELKALKIERDTYKDGLQDLYKAVTEMSMLVSQAINLASKIAGNIPPSLSEETKKQLRDFGIIKGALEERKGKVERITEKISSLVKEEQPKIVPQEAQTPLIEKEKQEE